MTSSWSVGMAQMKGSQQSFQPPLTGPGSLAGKEKIAEVTARHCRNHFKSAALLPQIQPLVSGGLYPVPLRSRFISRRRGIGSVRSRDRLVQAMGRRSAGSGRAADRARSGGHRPRPAAAWPSVIAHAINDCPRPTSPATTTPPLAGPSVLVAGNVAAPTELHAQVGKQPAMFGAEET